MAKQQLTDTELRTRAEAALERWVRDAERQMFLRCIVLACSEVHFSEKSTDEINSYKAAIQARKDVLDQFRSCETFDLSDVLVRSILESIED